MLKIAIAHLLKRFAFCLYLVSTQIDYLIIIRISLLPFPKCLLLILFILSKALVFSAEFRQQMMKNLLFYEFIQKYVDQKALSVLLKSAVILNVFKQILLFVQFYQFLIFIQFLFKFLHAI